MSQFAFLKDEFPDIFAHAARAENFAHSDPRAAAFYGRLALETAVNWLYRHDRTLKDPFEPTLAAHLAEPTFRPWSAKRSPPRRASSRTPATPQRMANRSRPDRRPPACANSSMSPIGSRAPMRAARSRRPTPPSVSKRCRDWRRCRRKRSRNCRRSAGASRRRSSSAKQAEARAPRQRRSRAALEAEIKALQAEIAAIKAANQTTADTHDYREAETRDLFIDLLLREAGFDPKAPDTIEVEVTGMPNAPGVGYVDYVLRGDDGKPLALVEAKRTRKDPRAGQQQAKLYADCLEKQYGQRPIIFYSNGYEHWIWDDTRHPPRPIQGFLKKDELALMIQRRETRKPLAPEDIDRAIVERFYQERAIRRIAEAFERDKQRKALLVMATGAGKTRTVIALADLLMRANWVKRVLFLADRKALVRQAANAFKAHLPGAATVNLLEEPAPGRPRLRFDLSDDDGLIDEADAGERRFGVGHFDLVVIDEAHRSVYRKYKAIFEYFDSLLVGLTATPKGEVDRDTYRLFDLQTGVPTDAYDLDEAVKDGFLVPPKAVSLTTDFLDRGIRYDQLSDEEKEAWDALEWDDSGTVPGAVDAPALNKWLFNADTVDRVLQHLMTQGIKVADGDRLGKTIIFAKSRAHAEFIGARFDANYPHLAGHFARVVVSEYSYAQSLVDDLYDPNKPPHIAISVDMLDTGIDVPEIVNLVFFKPVRSKTKFWQMIGRGTRLCPNLVRPGTGQGILLHLRLVPQFRVLQPEPRRDRRRRRGLAGKAALRGARRSGRRSRRQTSGPGAGRTL